MKKLFLLLVLLLSPSVASATIAVIAGTPNASSGNAQIFTQAPAATIPAGSDIVVVQAIRTVANTVSTVVDAPGNTYVFQNAINNGTVARVEVWVAHNTAFQLTSTQNVTVTLNIGASNGATAIAGYSGVAAIGINGTNTGSSTTPTISLTTQDSNNFVLAGFAAQGTATFSANVGILEASAVTSGGSGSSNVGGALNDNTAGSPSSVVNTVTLSATNAWAAVGVELRTVAPAGGGPPKLPIVGVGALIAPDASWLRIPPCSDGSCTVTMRFCKPDSGTQAQCIDLDSKLSVQSLPLGTRICKHSHCINLATGANALTLQPIVKARATGLLNIFPAVPLSISLNLGE